MVLRIGVEEEFLVVDPQTRHAVARAAAVRLAAAANADETGVDKELTEYQLEIATRPCATLEELRGQLTSARARLVAAATRAGCRVLPSGTAVLGGTGAPVTKDDRYRQMQREYREMLAGQGVCGCHVHVEMPDPETALKVSNHLRVWLPVLQSITVNSPYWNGVDTGYASWRTIVWSRWPVSGPAPCWSSWEQYEALVGSLITAGVIMDSGMVYWYLRPSAHAPTLEIRAFDVMPSVDDVVLVAALARALARVALAEVADGVDAVEVPTELLRAAHWRVARDGLPGDAVDPVSGRPTPAVGLVRGMIDRVRPALTETGDADEVEALYARLLERGCPASRQRAAFRRRGDPWDVVDSLVGEVTDLRKA